MAEQDPFADLPDVEESSSPSAQQDDPFGDIPDGPGLVARGIAAGMEAADAGIETAVTGMARSGPLAPLIQAVGTDRILSGARGRRQRRDEARGIDAGTYAQGDVRAGALGGQAQDRAAEAKKKKKAPAYKNKQEAIDDLVNLIDENYPREEVLAHAASLGVTEAEITAEAERRNPTPMGPTQQPQDPAAPQQGTIGPEAPVAEQARGIKDMYGQPAGQVGTAQTALERGLADATRFSAAIGVQAGTLSPGAGARKSARAQQSKGGYDENITAGLKKFGEAKTTAQTAQAAIDHPAAAFAMLTESLVASSPGLIATAGGSIFGPAGTAAGSALFGLPFNYGAAITQFMEEKGINPADPVAVERFFRDEKLMAEAREFGLQYSIPVTVMDALSAGMAGKFAGPVAKSIEKGQLAGRAAVAAVGKASALEMGMQAGSAAVGEAGGQYFSGQDYSPTDLWLEILADGPSAIAETAFNLLNEANNQQGAGSRGEPPAGGSIDPATLEGPFATVKGQFVPVEGGFQAPNGAIVTPEQWDGASPRVRQGWMQPGEQAPTVSRGTAPADGAQRYDKVDNEGRRYRAFESGGVIDDSMEKLDPFNPDRVYPTVEVVEGEEVKAAPSPGGLEPENETERAAELRRLADKATDPSVRAALLDQARELEAEVQKLESGTKQAADLERLAAESADPAIAEQLQARAAKLRAAIAPPTRGIKVTESSLDAAVGQVEERPAATGIKVAEGEVEEVAVGDVDPLQPAGSDRRRNTEQRAKVAEMSTEQMRKELLTSPVTGLGNKRAWEEAPRAAVQTNVDVDSLKWVNDTLGHEVGDQLLAEVGAAFVEAGAEAYHLSGDEFRVQAASPEEAAAIMRKVSAILAKREVSTTLPDGTVITKKGIGVSHGHGSTIDEAERNLQKHKSDRQKKGLRPERGAEPAGVDRRKPGSGDSSGGAGNGELAGMGGGRRRRPAVPADPQTLGQSPLLQAIVDTAGGVRKSELSALNLSARDARGKKVTYSMGGRRGELFRTSKGLEGDALVEWMEQHGYLSQDAIDEANANRTGGAHDLAYDLLRQEIENPGSVVPLAQAETQAEAAFARQARFDLESEARRLGLDDSLPDDKLESAILDKLEADWLDRSGLTISDAAKAARIARAAELDEAAFERAAMQYENDEPAFMRAIQEILDGNGETTDQRRQGNEPAAGAQAPRRAGGLGTPQDQQAGEGRRQTADNAQQGTRPGQGRPDAASRRPQQSARAQRDEASRARVARRLNSRLQREAAALWYSPLQRAVEDIKTNKAPAQQWLNTLAVIKDGNATPKLKGVTTAELEWSGLVEWLQLQGDRKIEKQEVVAFVRDSGLTLLEERWRGARPAVPSQFRFKTDRGGWVQGRFTRATTAPDNGHHYAVGQQIFITQLADLQNPNTLIGGWIASGALELWDADVNQPIGMPLALARLRGVEAWREADRRAGANDRDFDVDLLGPLIEEFNAYLEQENITAEGDAEDLLRADVLTPTQTRWMNAFVDRWDEAERLEGDWNRTRGAGDPGLPAGVKYAGQASYSTYQVGRGEGGKGYREITIALPSPESIRQRTNPTPVAAPAPARPALTQAAPYADPREARLAMLRTQVTVEMVGGVLQAFIPAAGRVGERPRFYYYELDPANADDVDEAFQAGITNLEDEGPVYAVYKSIDPGTVELMDTLPNEEDARGYLAALVDDYLNPAPAQVPAAPAEQLPPWLNSLFGPPVRVVDNPQQNFAELGPFNDLDLDHNAPWGDRAYVYQLSREGAQGARPFTLIVQRETENGETSYTVDWENKYPSIGEALIGQLAFHIRDGEPGLAERVTSVLDQPGLADRVLSDEEELTLTQLEEREGADVDTLTEHGGETAMRWTVGDGVTSTWAVHQPGGNFPWMTMDGDRYGSLPEAKQALALAMASVYLEELAPQLATLGTMQQVPTQAPAFAEGPLRRIPNPMDAVQRMRVATAIAAAMEATPALILDAPWFDAVMFAPDYRAALQAEAPNAEWEDAADRIAAMLAAQPQAPAAPALSPEEVEAERLPRWFVQQFGAPRMLNSEDEIIAWMNEDEDRARDIWDTRGYVFSVPSMEGNRPFEFFIFASARDEDDGGGLAYGNSWEDQADTLWGAVRNELRWLGGEMTGTFPPQTAASFQAAWQQAARDNNADGAIGEATVVPMAMRAEQFVNLMLGPPTRLLPQEFRERPDGFEVNDDVDEIVVYRKPTDDGEIKLTYFHHRDPGDGNWWESLGDDADAHFTTLTYAVLDDLAGIAVETPGKISEPLRTAAAAVPFLSEYLGTPTRIEGEDALLNDLGFDPNDHLPNDYVGGIVDYHSTPVGYKFRVMTDRAGEEITVGLANMGQTWLPTWDDQYVVTPGEDIAQFVLAANTISLYGMPNNLTVSSPWTPLELGTTAAANPLAGVLTQPGPNPLDVALGHPRTVDWNDPVLEEYMGGWQANEGDLVHLFGHENTPGGTSFIIEHPDGVFEVPLVDGNSGYTDTYDSARRMLLQELQDGEGGGPIGGQPPPPKAPEGPPEVAPLRRNRRRFTEGHWEEPDVVAHFRVAERTDRDGKRVLFVEEVQSDWAEKARKKQKDPITGKRVPRGFEAKGSVDRTAEIKALQDKAKDIRTNGLSLKQLEEYFQPGRIVSGGRDKVLEFHKPVDENDRWWVRVVEVNEAGVPRGRSRVHTTLPTDDIARQYEMQARQLANPQGMPRGPWVMNTELWTSLVLRRIIKLAVDEGFDRVAFTNGTQQNRRYSLSQAVKAIKYEKLANGNWKVGFRTVSASDISPFVYTIHGNDETHDLTNLTDDDLEEFMPEEVANRIREGEGELSERQSRILYGDKLEVGGKGMRRFYDEMIPQMLNKMLKKLGSPGKVFEVPLGVENSYPSALDDPGNARVYFEADGTAIVDPTADITHGLPIAEGYAEGSADWRNKIVEYWAEFNVPAAEVRMALEAFQSDQIDRSVPAAPDGVQPGFDVTPELREVVKQGMPVFKRRKNVMPFPRGKDPIAPAELAQRLADVRAELDAAFGPRLIQALLDKGILRLETSEESRSALSLIPDVMAVMSERDPRGPGASLFYDRMNPKNAARLLMHEIGEHYGMPRLLGDDAYFALLRRVNNAYVNKSDPEIVAAWEQIKADYVYPDDWPVAAQRGKPMMEEGSDEFVREVAANVIEQAPYRGWVREVLDAIRAWLYQMVGEVPFLGVDANLLRGLASSALRKAAGVRIDRARAVNDVRASIAPRSREADRIAPRYARAVGSTENPLKANLQPDLATALRDIPWLKHNLDVIFRTAPDLKGLGKGGTQEERARRVIDHFKRNLLALHDMMPAEQRARAKQWYVGGNRIAHRFASRFGVTPKQAAAVIAVFSPQRDWFQNVSMAERVMSAILENQDTALSAEQLKTLQGREWWGKIKPADRKALDGQTLRQVWGDGAPENRVRAAMWIRAWDEITNPKRARVITPEGEFLSEWDVTGKGEPIEMRWSSFLPVFKTFSLLVDGSRANVSRMVGDDHKVRSFYNNIIAPDSTSGDVTIDTHAMAGAHLSPLGGSDDLVMQGFGGGNPGGLQSKRSAVSGLSGNYFLYAEAYREAAQERGLLPREMQSITWEAVRGLFQPSQKAGLKSRIASIWRHYANAEITESEARAQVTKLAGGLVAPKWVGSGLGDSARTEASSYAEQLPPADLPGRPDAAARGARGAAPGAVPAGDRGRLITEGREYEGRLWGGAYSSSRLASAAKDAPIRKMVAAARERYNAIRAQLGLDPVTDWTKLPADLVQRQAPDMAARSGIRSRATPQAPVSQSNLDEEDSVRLLQRKFFDRFNRVRQLQERIPGIADDMNVVQADTLYYGRAQFMGEELERQFIDPLGDALKAAKKIGVTVRDADDFLMAKHAPERNRVIAQRNPNMPTGGSGLTDAQARAILAAFNPQQTAALEAIAQIVYNLHADKLRRLESYGLITPALAQTLRSQYQFYVPLKTLDDEDAANGVGRGYEIRNPGVEMSFGRMSKAGSPIAASLMDAARSIVLAEKARVDQVLWNLAGDPRVADVLVRMSDGLAATTFTRQRYNPDTRQIETIVDANWRARDDIMKMRIAGEEVYLWVRDDLLRDQLRKVATLNDPGAVLRAVGKVTGTIGRTLTEFNPAFTLPNAVRDSISSFIRARGIDRVTPRKVLIGIPSAWKMIVDFKRDKNTPGAQIYREFQEDGGKTGAYGITDLVDTMHHLEKMGAELGYAGRERGLPTKVWHGLGKLAKLVSHGNEVIEYATRLSLYREARANGYTRKQAAVWAKEISVNFNRSGEYGRTLNSVFVFANAALQGLYGSVMFMKSHKVRWAMLGLVVLGAAAQAWNEIGGGDDEDTGEKNVNTLSDYHLDHNAVWLLPGQSQGVKIPLPPEYSFLWATGRRLYRAMSQGDVKKEAGGIAGAFLGSTLPVRAPDASSVPVSAIKALTPTAVLPFMDIAINENFMGAPIVAEQRNRQAPQPYVTLARRNTSDLAKSIAELVNTASGGDRIEPGAAQDAFGPFVSAEAMEHVVGYYTGGIGQFGLQSTNMVKALAGDAESVDVNKIPIANRFIFKQPQGYVSRRYRELAPKFQYAIARERDGTTTTMIEPQVAKSLPEYRGAEKELRLLFADLRRAGEEGDESRKKALEGQIRQVQTRVIKAYNDARE